MALRQKNKIVEITLIMTMTLATQAVAQNPSSRCEKGWTFFREPNGNNGMCYLAVHTQLDAPAARRYCEDRVSHLVNLDRLDKFSYFDQNQQQISVPQFILDNFKDFWSGMRISGHRHLMWDAYGPKFVKRPKYSSAV